MKNQELSKTVLATAEALDLTSSRSYLDGDIFPILREERIETPAREDYKVPDYLRKTAPHMVAELELMLQRLFDINEMSVGASYYELNAFFGIVGTLEELESDFYSWCLEYFDIRGNPSRLNHQNYFCPWLLFIQCHKEFFDLIERHIIKKGTINAIALNLAQRFFHSEFATRLFEVDLKKGQILPSRFLNAVHRDYACRLVEPYVTQAIAFSNFIDEVATCMPAAIFQHANSAPNAIRERLQESIDDMTNIFRHLFPTGLIKDSESVLIAEERWAKLDFAVASGGLVLKVITSNTPDGISTNRTMHALGYRRDGLLCNYIYPWLNSTTHGVSGLAVACYLLDLLTIDYYERWDACNPEAILDEGASPGATEEQQAAALSLAYSQPSQTEKCTSRANRKLPELRLSRILSTLTEQFNCTCKQGKGSEITVFRPEASIAYTFGRHKTDPRINGFILLQALKRLGITTDQFLLVAK